MASLFGEIRAKLLKPFILEKTPELYLGAFGKHPGWNDHIEDIGLETEALLAVKQALYVQGVGGIIDGGDWDSLPEGESVQDFGHVFAWFWGSDLIVGRLWSSTDGKGRSKYPMIVCAHLVNHSPESVISLLLTELEQMQKRCVAVKSSQEIISILDDSRSRMRQMVSNLPPPLAPSPDGWRNVLSQMGFAQADGRLFRIIYCIQNQMAGYQKGQLPAGFARLNAKALQYPLLPQQIRLPADKDFAGTSFLLWRDFFSSTLDPETPLLLIHPDGNNWMDAITGMPAKNQLFCLKASPAKIPFAHDVPYNIPEEFRSKVVATFPRFF